jgi:hypothetical protein
MTYHWINYPKHHAIHGDSLVSGHVVHMCAANRALQCSHFGLFSGRSWWLNQALDAVTQASFPDYGSRRIQIEIINVEWLTEKQGVYLVINDLEKRYESFHS